MAYIKAQSVLPEEIINLIQQYVDGECLYILRMYFLSDKSIRRIINNEKALRF